MKSSIFWDNAVQSVESQPRFRRNVSSPSSGRRISQHEAGRKQSLLPAYSWTLKSESTCFNGRQGDVITDHYNQLITKRNNNSRN
jgi:hypothetical protein